VESHLSNTSAKVRDGSNCLKLPQTASCLVQKRPCPLHEPMQSSRVDPRMLAVSAADVLLSLPCAVLRRDHTAAAKERRLPGLEQRHRPLPGEQKNPHC